MYHKLTKVETIQWHMDHNYHACNYDTICKEVARMIRDDKSARPANMLAAFGIEFWQQEDMFHFRNDLCPTLPFESWRNLETNKDIFGKGFILFPSTRDYRELFHALQEVKLNFLNWMFLNHDIKHPENLNDSIAEFLTSMNPEMAKYILDPEDKLPYIKGTDCVRFFTEFGIPMIENLISNGYNRISTVSDVHTQRIWDDLIQLFNQTTWGRLYDNKKLLANMIENWIFVQKLCIHHMYVKATTTQSYSTH